MLGWIFCAALYVIGSIEVYMVRREVDADMRTRVAASFLWPVFVLWALIFDRRGLFS